MRLHLATLLTALLALNIWMALNAFPRERPRTEQHTSSTEFGFPWICYERWPDATADLGYSLSDWKKPFDEYLEDQRDTCGLSFEGYLKRSRYITTQKIGPWEIKYMVDGWHREALWANAVLGILATLCCAAAAENSIRRRGAKNPSSGPSWTFHAGRKKV